MLGRGFLSAEEEKALLPFIAKWEQELASIEEQLTSLTDRKIKLSGLLAAFKGTLQSGDSQSSTAVVPLPQEPAPIPPTPAALRPVSGREAGRGRKFTPVEAYWLPTLQALAELGGKARRDEVVDLVGKKMQGVLTPDDLRLLPSGVEVRWKNRVAWQRENMKRLGLLRDDSPQGIWEITEAGQQWLQNMSGRIFFFTLAALRVGNLSGSQAHPVKMGDYRNFVRQYAQEFGDPSLGEADDHILTDPMELMWKQGCMELKKYDPVKNEWWDFAELQDIRRLVGRGDWTMKLTAEGRDLLDKMEGQAKLLKKNPIGFHA